MIWNIGSVTVNNKSVCKKTWIERGIILVTSDGKGNIYDYKNFLRSKFFLNKYKEFISGVYNEIYFDIDLWYFLFFFIREYN